MLKIGITGGIGSGKSVVAKMFAVLNIPVFDADAEAKSIMETDPVLKQQLIENFGHEVFTDARLNRKYLASIVFNNPLALEKLNQLTHPAVIRKADEWFLQFPNAPYVVKEAALVFESGSGASLDYIIGVTAPKPIRIRRAMLRDNISRDEVIARMNRQIDDTIKMRLCNFVIINDEQHSVIEQVYALHQYFLKETGKSAL